MNGIELADPILLGFSETTVKMNPGGNSRAGPRRGGFINYGVDCTRRRHGAAFLVCQRTLFGRSGFRVGAVLATSIVRRYVTLQLQHHDRASLLAGKLHPLLQRPYLKGRDLYDLLWYLSDPGWPAPNLILLNNALQQTGWKGKPLSGDTWRPAARKRLQAIEWQQVMNDVRPFLEPNADPQLLTQENLLRVLGK